MNDDNSIKIGEYKVDKDYIHRIHYETACNYTDIEIKAGNYDVITHGKAKYGSDRGYVRLNGICVESYYRNSFLTASIDDKDKNKGEPYNTSESHYIYNLAVDENFTLTDERLEELFKTEKAWVKERNANKNKKSKKKSKLKM